MHGREIFIFTSSRTMERSVRHFTRRERWIGKVTAAVVVELDGEILQVRVLDGECIAATIDVLALKSLHRDRSLVGSFELHEGLRTQAQCVSLYKLCNLKD